MEKIIFSGDTYQMNWLREDFVYGEVTCPQGLSAKTVTVREGDQFRTEITITNQTEHPFFTGEDSISIAFPLQDRYEGSEICMKRRCHAHIFCGGDVSYIMALRMGGEALHFGMFLTKGSLCGYSIRRDVKLRSNDRGCFLLHPSPMEILPGETEKISWTIFPHEGKEDFFAKLRAYGSYIRVEAQRYVLFKGESSRITIRSYLPFTTVKIDGHKIAEAEDGTYSICYEAQETGEKKLLVEVDQKKTWCRLFVQEAPTVLAKRRCAFLASHQQYYGKYAPLRGAYLTYDNEEEHMVYLPINDYNGGRERVAMGVLMAQCLRLFGKDFCKRGEESLRDYAEYVKRELVDENGRVYNDIQRDFSYRRAYNFPWFAQFYLELWKQSEDPQDLEMAYKIIRTFYEEEGGASFYPIALPGWELFGALCENGKTQEAARVKEWLVRHGTYLLEMGTSYPKSEVNFEQSIVAPAADVLLQAYLVTEEERFLKGAKEQIDILDLFNGTQPDFHLYETAIRHWDGYWFGKRQLYGDTFPHYWSALTGKVFTRYGKITGNKEYEARGEASERAVLPLLFPDGRASCAYLYAHSVNGIRAEYFDPYANDQDWGLYFYLKAKEEKD